MQVELGHQRGDVELTRTHERQHAFPGAVQMTERTLQCSGFDDEAVETKANGSRTPADFGDLSVGADHVERLIEGFGDADGIDDEMRTKAVAGIHDGLDGIHFVGDEDVVCAHGFGEVESMAVASQPDDTDATDAGDTEHGDTHQTDRAGSEDDGVVGRAGPAFLKNRVISDTTRLGHRRMCHRDAIGYTMQNRRAAEDVVGHRAIGTESEPFAGRADVVLTGTTVGTDAADPRSSLGDNALADAEFADACAECDDFPCEFVTEDTRPFHLVVVTLPDMDVGAADPDGADLHQHLTGSR